MSSKLNFIENPASKNCEKMVDFFDEILAQMLQNRGLEGVWAPPWGVLEGSGRLLGGSWLQEASGVICRLLSGVFWAAPEPSWGPSWTQVEGQKAP